MWIEEQVMRRDLDRLLKAPLPWSKLDGKTVLVTGATGLIGSAVVNGLLYYGLQTQNPPQVLALVRSEEKAQRILGAQLADCPNLRLVKGDVTSLELPEGDVDYIIHAASQTSSRGFVETPVETITTTLDGTRRVLELARAKNAAIVYLSSMEVYGTPEKGHRVTEADVGALVPTKVRNSYPLSKQMAECLCASYAAEYGVHSRILRLTQTFGPGVAYQDGRVFAEFARCALEKRDIVLKTKGETMRSYLYTMDAVSAILKVLLEGADGEAYTAANEGTFCSILEMAELVCGAIAKAEIAVRFELTDVEKLGYAGTLFMDLDTAKLQALGWKPEYGLEEMYRNMIETMR